MEWIYIEAGDTKIRINKNNSRDIYTLKENKRKPPYWFKKTLRLTGDYYSIEIKGLSYRVDRLVYKAYNPNWDIDDISKNNVIKHINTKTLDNQIKNLCL